MFDIQKAIPKFLNEKGNIIRLIFFTAIFALTFINIYAPFGVKFWFSVTKWELFAYSSLVTLTGVLVVVVSRVIMYYVSKHSDISYWQYFVWVFAEVVSMALFYALFEKYILKEKDFFLDLVKISAQNTALVLFIPYSTMWLFFSWRDKKIQLDNLSQGQPLADNSKNMIPFHDEKGILRISIKMDNLLFLEASDNYVNIHYLNKEKVSRFMLRNSLKRLEEELKNTELIRCHRSYMVNFEKIKIIRKEKDGLVLEFDLPFATDIPVSKSYVENVMSTFAKFSNT
jgi:hypothetical protein